MRRVLGGVGRALVTVGLLLLFFVAYQLWGTGILQARTQDKLRDQFNSALEQGGVTTTTAPVATPTTAPATTTTLPEVTVPPNGEKFAQLTIPAIGLDQIAVEGVDVDDLTKGPGHYPTTQIPGHEGNTAFAGHRTTYGHPFTDLDQMKIGDAINFTMLNGAQYTYKVTEEPRAVDPSEVSVLDPVPDPARPGHSLATLTLTTCNPKYSAEQRLIIRAQLELPKGAAPLAPVKVPVDKKAGTIDGLSGDSSSRGPTILWGSIVLVIGLLWWWLFHRHPRWTTWLIGAVPFFVVLFVAFTYLERLLPSNY
jgi:sortase A